MELIIAAMAALLASQHAAVKAKPKVRVRLHLENQTDEKQTFEITVDSKPLAKHELFHSSDPFTSFEDTTLEIEEGIHTIRVFVDGEEKMIREDFHTNRAFKVTSQKIEEFEYKKRIGY